MRQAAVLVSSVEELMPRTFLMWLNAPEIVAEGRPGQFLMIRCGPDTVLRRPLSVHKTDGENIALLFQVRARGTHWLSQQKRGDRLDVFGPMGNGFRIAQEMKNLLLVAGGIGIAPLICLADEMTRAGRKVTLLAGAATSNLLYPRRLLPPGVEYVTATEDGSEGHRGMVTELLPDYAVVADLIIACGPLPMYRHMAQNLDRCGIAGKSVQVSMEMRMACGMGVCYGCTIRTKNGVRQACKDGPVFELSDIVWDDLARV